MRDLAPASLDAGSTAAAATAYDPINDEIYVAENTHVFGTNPYNEALDKKGRVTVFKSDGTFVRTLIEPNTSMQGEIDDLAFSANKELVAVRAGNIVKLFNRLGKNVATLLSDRVLCGRMAFDSAGDLHVQTRSGVQVRFQSPHAHRFWMRRSSRASTFRAPTAVMVSIKS